MDPNKKKELQVFLMALVMVGVTFAGGIAFLRSNGDKANADLLADIGSTAQPASSTASTTLGGVSTATTAAASKPSSTVTSVTTTFSPKIASTTHTSTSTVAIATSTKLVSPSAPKSNSTSTPTPIPVPRPTSTPVITTTTKALPFAIASFSKSQDWEDWWGNFVIGTSSLVIDASKTGTSGGVLLGGTNEWGDYTFNTTVDWVAGETFGLMARYEDSDNYTVCEFDEQNIGDVTISLEQYVNGNENTLISGDVLNYNQWGGTNINAYIKVEGAEGACGFDGHNISSFGVGTGSDLNPPYAGQIGFTTWDPSEGNSEIVVKSVDVESLQ